MGGPSSNSKVVSNDYWPVVLAAFEAELEASMAAVEAVLEASIAVLAALFEAVASAAAVALSAGAAGLLQAATDSAPTAAPATSNERTKVEVMIPGPLG